MSVLAFLPRFLYSQFFITSPVPTTSFEGKTVIVTGANVRRRIFVGQLVTARPNRIFSIRSALEKRAPDILSA